MLKITTALYGDLFIIAQPPKEQATEGLEFVTDVIPSYTNEYEERSQMRALPRQSFAFEYSVQRDNMAATWNAVYAGLRLRWAIPLWFEAQQISVVAGQMVLPVDTVVHDIRANSLVMLYSIRGGWEVKQVDAIDGASATLHTATALTGRVFVMGVRVGTVSGQAPFRPTGFRNSVKVTYYVQDVLAGLTWDMPQFNGLDLDTTPYEIEDNAATQLTQTDTQIEYSVGGIAQFTPWKRPQYGGTRLWKGFSVADLRALRSWFYRRAGKFRPFYSPTFESDLRKASTGPVASTFKVLDDGYRSMVWPTQKLLAFGLGDGSWQLRTAIAALDLGGNTTQLGLDSPLGVDSHDILTVSRAAKYRLDTDRLEITLNPNGVSSTSYTVLEVNS